MKLLLKNALIVSGEAVFSGDALLEDGIISRVEADIPAAGARVIDAAGKYLLPGGVDAHTHLDLDTGTPPGRTADDFYTGTVAAACGGTTTIVDHPGFGPEGCRLDHQIEVYRGLARRAVIDYGFHGVIQHVDESVLADMERLLADGIASYKIYLTYARKVDDEAALAVLARAKELGLVICAHCENDALIRFRTRRFLAEGKGAPRYHAESRPVEAEAEAVWRMLMLASAAGDAPLYVAHLSSALGLEAARMARQRGQTGVLLETCPQYLLLDASRYGDEREGLKYVMSPPLRSPEDNKALWRALRSGDIDAIGTDHCPFNFATQKMAGLGEYTRCPNGVPGIESRMSLLFSEGFMKGRLTLPELVRLCCANPARIFGLHPQKGCIAPGADADLVLFDPAIRKTLTRSDLHENVDYTPYEGMTLQGAPVMTISRGEIIAENGVFSGAAGRGRYLARRAGRIV